VGVVPSAAMADGSSPAGTIRTPTSGSKTRSVAGFTVAVVPDEREDGEDLNEDDEGVWGSWEVPPQSPSCCTSRSSSGCAEW
jgi:hypothetical protein